MSQHTGAPAEPTVKRGDRVSAGQVIGLASGFISANVHSPVAGKVSDIGRYPHPLGGEALAVVIKPDGEGEERDFREPVRDPERLSPGEAVNMVKEAGIVGLGGAAFPTHVKLSPPAGKKIDTVILNGAECEPYLTADHRLMVERPEDVIAGLVIARKILGAERSFVAIEANKPDAAREISRAGRKAGGVQVRLLPVRYPQGGEKQLIFAVTGRRVPPPPGLPMDVGCLVLNVGTAVAIYEAVRFGKPLIERVITATGGGFPRPGNFKVKIGTPLGAVIEACGGLKDDTAKVVFGGPMMGLTQHSDQVPVIKGTSGVLALSWSETRIEKEAACIHCGRCVDACPMNLIPTTIASLVDGEMWEEAESYHVLSCIECGSCAYVCPARIKLVQRFKYAKSVIQSRRRREAAGKGAA